LVEEEEGGGGDDEAAVGWARNDKRVPLEVWAMCVWCRFDYSYGHWLWLL